MLTLVQGTFHIAKKAPPSKSGGNAVTYGAGGWNAQKPHYVTPPHQHSDGMRWKLEQTFILSAQNMQLNI